MMLFEKHFHHKPTVAFKRNKTIRNHLVRSDIKEKERKQYNVTKPCEKCKLCMCEKPNLITTKHGMPVKSIGRGNCKTTNVVCAAWCNNHNALYNSQTREKLSDIFNKHRYGIKKHPHNSELAQHFHADHDLQHSMKVLILVSDLKTPAERELKEDRWICKLQISNTPATGINTEMGSYG